LLVLLVMAVMAVMAVLLALLVMAVAAGAARDRAGTVALVGWCCRSLLRAFVVGKQLSANRSWHVAKMLRSSFDTGAAPRNGLRR
jgi:type II secretory pathway pseudopilin PulG